ncbi:MAG: hypothetical protein IJD33_01975 [Clostridia bacterium]|nr:hypothetical protein [Clostridia bacterium]
MAEATKKRSSIKEGAKKAASKVKSGAKKAAGAVKSGAKKVKTAAKDYSGKVRASYNKGFEDGYNAAIPEVVGAITAATIGYNHGAKQSKREKKAKKRMQK